MYLDARQGVCPQPGADSGPVPIHGQWTPHNEKARGRPSIAIIKWEGVINKKFGIRAGQTCLDPGQATQESHRSGSKTKKLLKLSIFVACEKESC